MGYRLQYYDLVLGGVLASLLVGIAIGRFSPYPLAATVPIFAVLAALIIGHGLFVNGPVDRPADLTDEVSLLE